MDSRDASIHSRQLPQTQTPQGLMLGPFTSFGQHFPNNAFMMGSPNFGANLMQNPNISFNQMSAKPPTPFDAAVVTQHQQQIQQQYESPGSGVSGSGPTAAASGGEQVKRKRGRPRKVSPDGSGLALSSNSQVVSKAAGGISQSELEDTNVEGPQEKRQRGRPPGSGKKQMDAVGGTGGVGFKPHVIVVSAGENIVSKMVEFSQEGARMICILSANGAVQNVTLRKVVGGSTYYEGQLEIISLAGSFCCVNSDGSQNNAINLTVSLAGPDGKVVGGGITGELIAATSIQIVAGSFIADKKKSTVTIPAVSPTATPTTSVPHMLSFGSPAPQNNSSQHDATSDSSDDSANDHRLNQTPAVYNYGLGQPWTGATPGWE